MIIFYFVNFENLIHMKLYSLLILTIYKNIIKNNPFMVSFWWFKVILYVKRSFQGQMILFNI